MLAPLLTLKLPDKLQPYGLYVYYVVHICDFGMLRVKQIVYTLPTAYVLNFGFFKRWVLYN